MPHQIEITAFMFLFGRPPVSFERALSTCEVETKLIFSEFQSFKVIGNSSSKSWSDMLLQMGNQVESKLMNWLQKVYPYTICGGVLGAILGLGFIICVAFADNRLPLESWIQFVCFLVAGAVVGSGCGVDVILRKMSLLHHFTICGAVMGAIVAFVIVVWMIVVWIYPDPDFYNTLRLILFLTIPFVFCSIGGAIIGAGIGLWDRKYFKKI